jgi:ubiquinone/menaquinone biosynthesis C-methylase UbiE
MAFDVAELLDAGRTLRPAAEGIVSALPADAPPGEYDGFAHLYDTIVGTDLYHRIMWGNRAAHYRELAERAVAHGCGPYLDAGCGSAVFTASAYARANRPLVLVDLSVGMLAAAERRLREAGGAASAVRIQADLFDLPFRARSFDSVMSMGVLHLFDDATGLLARLRELLAPGGKLFFSSLVNDTPRATRYMAMLHRKGHIARPRSFAEVRAMAEASGARVDAERRGSMAYLSLS